jgi:Zn-dependent metalloprotease
MRNITENQRSILDNLRSRGLRSVSWSEDRGVAAYTRGNFGHMGSAPLTAVRGFFEEFGDAFGPPELVAGLRHIRTRPDRFGWFHLEFQQTYLPSVQPNLPDVPSAVQRSLDVYGGFLVAHVDTSGELVEVQSSCWRDVFVFVQTLISEREIRTLVLRDFLRSPGLGRLFVTRQRPDLNRVLFRGKSNLVVLPFEGGFRLAWQLRGVVARRPGLGGAVVDFLPGERFFDAVSGERLKEGVFASDVDNPDTGSGRSHLPFGGPFTNRTLEIIRVDASDTYRLRDTTHSRDIITYDRAGADPDYIETPNLLTDGAFQISTDNDGDKNWNEVAADDSMSELTASQQTEVDAHYNIGRVYEWYDAIAGPGGRAGFDDGNYGSAVPSNMPVHLLAHVNIGNAQFYMWSNDAGDEVSWVQVGDTISDDGHRAWAASPFVMCHEYQHGITAHSVGGSVPGFASGFDDWPRAVTEGLSDVFGGLFSDGWHAGSEISPSGTILRNLAFPRDTEAGSAPGKDHFADAGNPDGGGFAYPAGQILAHCAYLMSQGGVHQRAGRTPELIPTHGLGKQETGGLNVATAARIWYRMMATRFAATGPYDTEEAFERIRTECVASAIDLFGEDSHEHREAIQAFYAVGLHPVGESYGADVTFLPWGHRWRFSRPYVGLSSPSWASLDLFINNGGASEWNAIVNAEGAEVVFENNVYCRVRNVGDQAATNVRVTFEYARHGTAPVIWQPMINQDGVAQELNIDTLAAGASNFDMDAQDSPPDEARVMWHIPPLPPDEEVDHFCIRATVTADNDVHPFNNTVQSNVAYTVMSTRMRRTFGFTIGNPTERPLPAVLAVDTTLPRGWRVNIWENLQGVVLNPREERVVHLDIERPDGPDYEPPFDGEVRGEMCGDVTGSFTGLLANVSGTLPNIRGTLAARIAGGFVNGRFVGKINLARAEITGTVTGSRQCAGGMSCVCVTVRACLRPHRRIDIQQKRGEEALGGVTFQVQLPVPSHCKWPIPPADTEYRPGLCDVPEHPGMSCNPVGRHEGKVSEILYDCFGDFEGFILNECPGERCFKCKEKALEEVVLRAFRERFKVIVQADTDHPSRPLKIALHS